MSVSNLQLAVRLRRASLKPGIPAYQAMKLRLASRLLFANVTDTTYDLMFRLQVLGGVAETWGIRNADKWWQNPSRGLAEAVDLFEDTDIDPRWLTKSNTNMAKKILAITNRAVASMSRSNTVILDAEDMVQKTLMGLGQGSFRGTPAAVRVGLKRVDAIINGKLNPDQVASVIGGWVAKKVKVDEVKKLDRMMGSPEDAEGRSIIDRREESVLRKNQDFGDMVADMLSEPSSPLRVLLQKEIERVTGSGKWAQIAMRVIQEKGLDGGKWGHGEKTRWAEEYDMAPGTFTKVMRDKVLPALEALQRPAFKQKALQTLEGMGRYASTQGRRQKRAGSFGVRNLDSIIPRREMSKLIKALRDDPASSQVLQDIRLELVNRLDVDPNTEAAINKLNNVVGGNFSPEGARNQLFKIADLLKIKLPHSIF